MQSVFAVQESRATARQAPSCLRILFLVSAHNSLSQRIWAELTGLGHEVEVAVVGSAPEMEAAVAAHDPELIVCPMLKTMIPSSVWSTHRCLVVHPGPPGDRGPSSLDWAIELGAESWGVTVLQADAEPDAGPIWASRSFDMRPAGKSSLYRHEVRRAATAAVREAVTRAADPDASPATDAPAQAHAHGAHRSRPLMTQGERRIDWHTSRTETVVRRIRAAEGHPGVLDTVEGVDAYLFGVHRESRLRGSPGEIIAQRHGAICRATVDGAVWITHLKRRQASSAPAFKLPATRALQLAGVELAVPEIPAPVSVGPGGATYRDIAYEEHAGVGRLTFDFYNGAMSTDQCRRLHDAYRYARSRSDTRVIVLCGGADFFSNGIHLNVIEAAPDPARESWENLRAIDDLVRDIIITDSHLVIAVPAGRRRGRRGSVGARRRRGVRAPGRGAQPVLRPHGRPIWIRVLDIPAAPARRIRPDRGAHRRAVHAAECIPGGAGRAPRWRSRRRCARLSRSGIHARSPTRGGSPARSAPGGQTPAEGCRRGRPAAGELSPPRA